VTVGKAGVPKKAGVGDTSGGLRDRGFNSGVSPAADAYSWKPTPAATPGRSSGSKEQPLKDLASSAIRLNTSLSPQCLKLCKAKTKFLTLWFSYTT